ncbi:RTA1-domain-containing protein [Auriscalpium vulgare]|uniref:RTA1-domain-containing protein n=1 Tax=Auriscalpium vulgare TaxID=40419 RepID=A0ACB8RXQ5_9AGAM|nr:RTA1-domain-containing protein [Auriscalpium vulgare]
MARQDLDRNAKYHYVPTEWIAIVFVVLFSISTILHLGQAIRWRIWWLLPTAVLCGLLEVAGWSGRLWSSFNIDLRAPFMLQIVATIIAPTPLVAANFVLLGRIIRRLGTHYSRLGPKLYTTIFLSCDIVSLVVQGGGGGIASGNKESDARVGSHIMLGGIVFQLVVITCYTVLAAEFLLRYVKDKPFGGRNAPDQPRGRTDKRMKILLGAMSLMTLFLVIRSVYRTIELADGWNGKVISTQVLFNVFDGAMVTLAMYTLNICHPGYLLHPEEKFQGDPDIPLAPYAREEEKSLTEEEKSLIMNSV